MLLLTLHAAYGGIPPSTLPIANPPWPPTWNMTLSTIAMPCNYTGYMNPAALGGSFGITSFDWR
jgi:hypothetical protein